MTDKACWESFKVEGESVVDKIKRLIHAGVRRRIVVQHEAGRLQVSTDFLSGGTVLAPSLRQSGPVAAQDCTIQIERVAERRRRRPKTEAGAGIAQH